MNNEIDMKRSKEKKVTSLMIKIYCNGNHGKNEICESCNELISYVEDRIDKCPFMETKTFCSNCEVHCYNKKMREKIKKVMRYSGPRMIFHHPILLLDHTYESIKYKFSNKASK